MKNLYLCGSGFLANAFIRNYEFFQTNKISLGTLTHDFIYAHIKRDLVSSIIDLKAKEPDVIINLSGPTDVQESFSNPSLYLEAPLEQVKAHMKTLGKLERKVTYIYLSSAAVYGNTSVEAKESDSIKPESPYAEGKYNAEKFLLARDSIPRNVSVVILRATSVYDGSLTKRVLYLIKNALSANLSLELFGSGNETRDFLHSNDLCRFVSALVNSESDFTEVYNVGCGQSISLRELIGIGFIKYPNFQGNISFSLAPRIGDPDNMRVNIKKITSLGTFTLVSPQEGLGRYFEKK
jgi:UDP-glucose 4-epimerase